MDRVVRTRLTRRGLLAGGLGLTTAPLLGSATHAQAVDPAKVAAARREGRLVFYSGQTVEAIQGIAQSFERAYPGIRVEYIRGDLSQILQRYITETAAGRPSADVLDLVERRSKEMADRNLAASYRSPLLDAFPQDMRAPGDLWTNYAMHLGSFAWNTERVRAGEEPKEWNDLLNPRWRGRIGMQDPQQSGGSSIWIVTMFEAMGEQRWNEYMRQLATQQFRYGRYLQVQEMLVAGEIDVMVAAYPNYVEPVRQRGAPINWGNPRPTMRTFFSLTVAKNAANANAARLFCDHMLTADAQRLLIDMQLLPARRESWPAAYNRLEGTPFIQQAFELENTRPDWFRDRIREFFAPR